MDIPFPILLFVDGHSGHYGLGIREYCLENGILLHLFKAHCTQILQPDDLYFFEASKKTSENLACKWVAKNPSKTLTKYSKIKQVLYPAFETTAAKKENIRKSFKIAGIYPFDSRNVHWHKTKAADMFAKDDDAVDVPDFVVFPPLAPVLDIVALEDVVLDVAPFPPPPGSNGVIIDEFEDQSVDDNHLLDTGSTSVTMPTSGSGGAAPSSTSGNAFVSKPASTVVSAGSVFGSSSTSSARSVFGGASNTSKESVLGAAPSSTSASVFGSTPASSTTGSLFGSNPASSTAPAFGATPTSTSGSVFGSDPASTAAGSVFGSAPASSTSHSLPGFPGFVGTFASGSSVSLSSSALGSRSATATATSPPSVYAPGSNFSSGSSFAPGLAPCSGSASGSVSALGSAPAPGSASTPGSTSSHVSAAASGSSSTSHSLKTVDSNMRIENRERHLYHFEQMLSIEQVEEFNDFFNRGVFDIAEPLFQSWITLKRAAAPPPTEAEAFAEVMRNAVPKNIPRSISKRKPIGPPGVDRNDPNSDSWFVCLKEIDDRRKPPSLVRKRGRGRGRGRGGRGGRGGGGK